MCWRTIITKRQQIYYNVKFHCIFINRTHNHTLFRQFNFLFHLLTGCYTCHGYGHKAKFCTSTDEGKTAIKSPLYLSLLQKSMLIYCYAPFVLLTDDNIKCYSCKGLGHKKAMCPTPRARVAPNKWHPHKKNSASRQR